MFKALKIAARLTIIFTLCLFALTFTLYGLSHAFTLISSPATTSVLFGLLTIPFTLLISFLLLYPAFGVLYALLDEAHR